MNYFAALRTFVRAAELKSFTQTAKELSIKTSTVSRHISDLEADLCIALFNRSTRGLSLTEGGHVFYVHASQILHDLEEARNSASSLNHRPAGKLRATVPVSFGHRHVMPFIIEFMETYPDIDVELIYTDDTLNLIESSIDVGIRIGALNDSSLQARRLAPHHRVACASQKYLQEHGIPTTLAALKDHQFLTFSRTSGDEWYAVHINTPANNWEKISPHGRFVTNDSEALLHATLNGQGVALLPTWLIFEVLRSGHLVKILSDWDFQMTPNTPSIWAIYPRKKTVSSKVRAFIDFFAEKFGEPPYWEKDELSY